MEANTILIVKIIVLGLIHWTLVPIALQALIERRRVIGGKKAPWAAAIVLLTGLGSLLYLIFHPQLQRETQTRTEVWW